MARVSSRYVEFTIYGDALTPAEITRVVGMKPDAALAKGEIRPDAIWKRPSATHRWKLFELGDSGSYVTDLVERMISRIRGVESGLKEVVALGSDVLLGAVIYASDDDPTGPSFVIELDAISFLSSIPAAFEVNIYPS